MNEAAGTDSQHSSFYSFFFFFKEVPLCGRIFYLFSVFLHFPLLCLIICLAVCVSSSDTLFVCFLPFSLSLNRAVINAHSTLEEAAHTHAGTFVSGCN